MRRFVPFAMPLSIWKERDDRIFRGASSTVDDLMSFLVLRVAKWASSSTKSNDLHVDGILYKWEASLLVGHCNVKRVVP